MALTPGTRLGVYEVTASIGEGGMGQVFRARDTKLDRDVAIKILPEAFAHDADRLARFQREAKTLASLNHPHIAAIYGLEESPSTGSRQAGISALEPKPLDARGRHRRHAGRRDDARPAAAEPHHAVLSARRPSVPLLRARCAGHGRNSSHDPQTNSDLWVVPMVGDHTPSVFLKTPFREIWGVFSPDSRWVAYMSNESGRMEIYVRPFVPPVAAGATAPAAGGKQVSTAGGIMPLWRPDGRELYYLNPGGAMMAVPITVTGPTLEPGAPMVLFQTHILGGGTDNQQNRQYDVAPDGRFLINTVLEGTTAPITLLMNWNPEVKK